METLHNFLARFIAPLGESGTKKNINRANFADLNFFVKLPFPSFFSAGHVLMLAMSRLIERKVQSLHHKVQS
jgi:hypothetical protein